MSDDVKIELSNMETTSEYNNRTIPLFEIVQERYRKKKKKIIKTRFFHYFRIQPGVVPKCVRWRIYQVINVGGGAQNRITTIHFVWLLITVQNYICF